MFSLGKYSTFNMHLACDCRRPVGYKKQYQNVNVGLAVET